MVEKVSTLLVTNKNIYCLVQRTTLIQTEKMQELLLHFFRMDKIIKVKNNE